MGKDEKCAGHEVGRRGAPKTLYTPRPRHPLPIGSVSTNTTTMKTVLALALMSLGAVTAWVPLHARLPRTVARAGRSTTSVSMAVEGTCLVSGFLDAQERTDQFAFDVPHKHGE